MRIGAVVVACMACALVGCDRQAEPDPAAASPGTPARRAPAGGFADAVGAVQSSVGQPLAGLSFLIEAAPVVGKPFPVKLYFKASQPVNGLLVSVESADLVATPAMATVDVTAAETPVELDLVVTAQKAGTWELAVSLRTADAAAATIYKLPVLVAAAG